MILKIKISSISNMSNLDEDTPEYEIVNVAVKDDSIIGVWATKELDEMHVYTVGGMLAVDYDLKDLTKIADLLGHSVEEIINNNKIGYNGIS